jgi:predicted metal-dependent enzyme (double-stranded beta helix superfamily)
MVSGKRVLSVATIVLALGNAALWTASHNYVNAGVWGLVGVVWLIRTSLEWNDPPSEGRTNPARDQLIFGALLILGLLAWFVWSP